MRLTKIKNLLQVQLQVLGLMRKEAVLRKGIFHQEIKIVIGKLKNNQQRFVTNTKLIWLQALMFVLIHCRIGLNQILKRENIPIVSLYYNQGEGKGYRSLGCWPFTRSVDSEARTVDEIIEELKTGSFLILQNVQGASKIKKMVADQKD